MPLWHTWGWAEILAVLFSVGMYQYAFPELFSEIYEPEWDSVLRKRTNDIQASQSEYSISLTQCWYRNGHMTQVKPIRVVSGPGAPREEPLAFGDHLSRTWQSQPKNEAEAQKTNKQTNMEPRVERSYFSSRESKKREWTWEWVSSLDSTHLPVNSHTYLKINVPLE